MTCFTDDKAGDIWSITRRNATAHSRYCMYEGALIKISTSLLVTLDYSAVPCEPQKMPLRTLATRLFRDDGFLLFKGPAGAMVPFWDEKPQAASLASTAPPQDKWPLPKDQVRTPSDPCLVEVAAPMTESPHSVKIVMGLLGPFLSIDKVITSSNVATLYQLKYQKRDSALLAHGFSYREISARCLEPDHVSPMKNTPTTSSPFSNVEEPLVPELLSPNSWNSKRNWTHHLRPCVTNIPMEYGRQHA